MSFEYNGWVITDEYVFDERCNINSQYTLKVISKDIVNRENLRDMAYEGREIIEIITKLLPYVAFVSLNEPERTDSTRTRKIINIGSALDGWINNYQVIDEELKKQENCTIKVTCTYQGTIHYAKLPKSPLRDLKVILENYEGLSESYEFLIFLHNAIIESKDINRYMLIGKALEIVNAIYPYQRKRGKNDDRVNRFHPELIPMFGKTTLKDLIEWSNKRRETRHYVVDKNSTISHPKLSDEEAEKLYVCSVHLITNIIRAKFGLETHTYVKL